MNQNTDVLIVGGGPTGLMMACQLHRFGIPFRIIDKLASGAKESRALAVQAKSMEIFQNLGIVDNFLKESVTAKGGIFTIGDQDPIIINLSDVKIEGAPYNNIYLIPQTATEKNLLSLLEKENIPVERDLELISFKDKGKEYSATIRNNRTNQTETITCRYIVGCDGSKSIVREVLGIPFVGGDYQQEFVLADVITEWSVPKNDLAIFITTEGLVAQVPLPGENTRIILAGMTMGADKAVPSLEAFKAFVAKTTKKNLKLRDPIWMANFHLHHRAVKQYSKGRAFLAGDAAHIHSPVGGQGMNTGFQDAVNLAWKIAFTLKYGSSAKLLDTYQTERQKVGEVLLKTTDRVFGMATSKNPFIVFFRQYIFPHLLRYFSKRLKFKAQAFTFISELGIHYEKSEFVEESISGADKPFTAGPKAGFRALDAKVNGTTLFELFRNKPFNFLIFLNSTLAPRDLDDYLSDLERQFKELVAIHKIIKSPDTKELYNYYNVSGSAIYIIRPDGYIGYRSFGLEANKLKSYLAKLLTKRSS